ncbi:hypothetical protein WS76_04615 [Burkholderia humptydooensis]|nr:hypothetical protein WS76_04615 [Burkholderia humptydooensis]
MQLQLRGRLALDQLTASAPAGIRRGLDGSFAGRHTASATSCACVIRLAYRCDRDELGRRNEGRAAEIAQRVGYSSASTFGVAFTRHVGRPPIQ